MTRDKGAMLEGFCWFIVGLMVMYAIVKLAYEYR